MRTKKEIKFLTELLNIEGIKVISHRQHEGIGIILQVEGIGKESNCPRCGKKSHIAFIRKMRYHVTDTHS
jgi:transposase